MPLPLIPTILPIILGQILNIFTLCTKTLLIHAHNTYSFFSCTCIALTKAPLVPENAWRLLIQNKPCERSVRLHAMPFIIHDDLEEVILPHSGDYWPPRPGEAPSSLHVDMACMTDPILHQEDWLLHETMEGKENLTQIYKPDRDHAPIPCQTM